MKKPKPIRAYGVMTGGRLRPIARGSKFLLEAMDLGPLPEELRKKHKVVRVTISLRD